MKEICRESESIEGLIIDGHARDPLRPRAPKLHENGELYSVYIASFDVVSSVIEPITGEMIESTIKKIEKDSCCDKGDRLICKKAIILSKVKKISSEHKSNVSATHGASVWHFSKHTNVKIELPHEEIVNAVNKRDNLIKGISNKFFSKTSTN